MEEILKKLFESELLSEETKTQLKEQFDAAVKALKEELALEVQAELVEQYTKDRDLMVEQLDTLVESLLAEELDELKAGVADFRDLEVEAASKIVEEKKRLAVQLGEEIDQLIDKLDAFLEQRIEEEMSSLNEDLQEVKQNKFGGKIFEAFMAEFNKSFVDEDSVHRKVSVLEDKLADAEARLAEAEKAEKALAREKKLDEVLAPLSGTKREQMQILLQNVSTSKLQESYNRFVGRLLKEDSQQKQLDENKTSTTVKTGDSQQQLSEDQQGAQKDQSKEAARLRLLSLAGVTA